MSKFGQNICLGAIALFLLLAILIPALGTAKSLSKSPRGQAQKGPELIRELFHQWHSPYPADLDRETLRRIWDEIELLPSEIASRGGASSAAWQPYGPFGMTTDAGGQFSGRIVDLNVGPTGIRAVAAASGGVWIREQSGWQAVTDELTTQWIGSFDIDPTDPNTFLVGTGEPFLRSGTGLWKSTDSGQSWSQSSMAPEPATCFRVRYSASGDLVHGAFDQGYYRSSDGGDTWTRHLSLGAWPTDMALHPTDPNTLYLTVWGEGLFRSTDAGLTWNEVLGLGLPQNNIGRGALTISASDPDRMYLVYAHTDGNLLGTFRTTDAGTTWVDVSPDEYLWGQGWYNNTIAVSPVDPDLVIAGGGGSIRTTDGGVSWTAISDPNLHADYHASTWSADGAELWLGHDGGWSYSSDAGASWDSSDNTLPITQYVLIGASSSETPFVLGGGSQDNGISITTNGGSSWTFGHGGDGGGFSVDPNNSNIMMSTAGIYSGIWPFQRLRSTNGGGSWDLVNGGIGLASQWWIRIRNDLGNPPNWYTYGNGFVFRSTTGTSWSAMNGNPTVFPHFVSELTASAVEEADGTVYACLASNIDGERLMVWDGAGFEERSAGIPSGIRVRKVPTHPRKSDWAFALSNGLGTPGEKVFRTTNRGVTWSNVTGNLPDVPVSDLVAHPTDDDQLFLGSEMGAFRTDDGGVTWERWHLGLPEAVVMTEMTFVDRLTESGEFFVLAGTYGRGIWGREVRFDDTTSLPPAGNEGRVLLHDAAPNPFQTTTAVSFTLARGGPVSLKIYDVLGREVFSLLNEVRGAGFHRIQVAPDLVEPGVYFVRLEASGQRRTQRLVRTEQ